MEFKLLGPLEVWSAGKPIDLGPPKQRHLLAVLLGHTGEVVSGSRLVEAVWGDRAPTSAADNVRIYIHRLRRILGAERIVSHKPWGYQFLAEPQEIDASRMAELGERAKAALSKGDAADARNLLVEGLRLWRDSPAAGLDQVQVARLEEERLRLLELRAEADLALGRHGDLVAELTALASQQPFREKLHAQLMLALYGCGRQAEALAVYGRVRRALDDELGVRPGRELRRVHESILLADPAIELPAPNHNPPAQLPPSPVHFTGRDTEVAWLDAASGGLVVIAGPPGVGKTALALQWAHRIAPSFPGGQLYVHLRGHSGGEPVTAAEAVTGLLRGLGQAPQDIPSDPDQAATLLRSLLARRKTLLLLDDARQAEQVRPLILSEPSLVLVTSRSNQKGLIARDGAAHLALGMLAESDAVALLSLVLGARRVAAEPQAVAELASLCGGLPLALRVAACHIAEQTGHSIAAQVEELKQDRIRRLSAIDDPDSAIKVVFDRSYHGVTSVEQRVFRLMGLLPAPGFSVAAVAAAADMDQHECRLVLDKLAATSLIFEMAPGRYGVHDLLAAYARELSAEEDTARARKVRLGAWLDWIQRHAERFAALSSASAALSGQRDSGPVEFDSAEGAIAWMDSERANVISAARFAAGHGWATHGWRIAYSTYNFFLIRRAPIDMCHMAEAASQAAGQIDDPHAAAAAEMVRSLAEHLLARNRQAIAHCRRARDIAPAGWTQLHSAALKYLHLYHLQLGELHEAAAIARQSLDLAHQSGRVAGQDYGRLALVDMMRGSLRQAAAHFEQALRLDEPTGLLHMVVISRLNLGKTYRLLGRFDDARTQLRLALDRAAEVGNVHITATAMANMAATLCDLGHHAAALQHADEALNMADDAADEVAAIFAHHSKAATLTAMGRPAEAIAELTATLERCRRHGMRHTEAEILVTLGEASLGGQAADAAADYATQALHVAQRGEFQLIEALAWQLLNRVHEHRRETEAAAHALMQAQTLLACTGQLEGAAGFGLF